MGDAIVDALGDRHRWQLWSRRGISGSRRHFSWNSHVQKYVRAVKSATSPRSKHHKFFGMKSRLITADRIVVCDIDNTLIGNSKALAALLTLLRDAGCKVALGIATGRSAELTRRVLMEWSIPTPQLLITSVGSAIRYGRELIDDKGWEKHINHRWRPHALREELRDVPGLKLQPEEGQARFKLSYDVDPEKMPPVAKMEVHLRRARLLARLVYSHQAYLDVLPIRASKGEALRYFCLQWGIPPERCLVAGDSGNDLEMLTGRTLGVVVGNYDPELEELRGHPQVYFAKGRYAWGIIEGIQHYDFLGAVRSGETETPDYAASTGD